MGITYTDRGRSADNGVPTRLSLAALAMSLCRSAICASKARMDLTLISPFRLFLERVRLGHTSNAYNLHR